MPHVMESMGMECGAKRARMVYITMAWFLVMVFPVLILIGTQDKHFLLVFAQGSFWLNLVKFDTLFSFQDGGTLARYSN